MLLFREKYGMQIDEAILSRILFFFSLGNSNSDAAESEGDAFFLQGFNETWRISESIIYRLTNKHVALGSSASCVLQDLWWDRRIFPRPHRAALAGLDEHPKRLLVKRCV